MFSLIDTHAHLDQLEDIEGAVQRARAAGVAAIIAVGMNQFSNYHVYKLAREHRGYVYPAFGIHPWAIEKGELEDTFEFIRAHFGDCVAVGEIGLDYWIKKDKKIQQEVFCRLLEAAGEKGKPISTHSRGSYEDVFQLVQEYGIKEAVFHWYSGPLEIVERIVESGYFVSATPAVEYSEKHRAVIEMAPLENLLLETDCPVKYKDVKSEPATLEVTLREVAKLKKADPADVARITTENARRIFRL
ncbi:MAG: TatD family deoxyribonuclease [Candidatus Abyssobacteria bacterium SURF_5]|uniref:TatD family deoxyribonuclease n=1 Tax=Abyssobacteria bacterium (strain SURF_5) TaxID=2093360 RepID=A0A3A4N2C3_ABYX5|nr:MAG: TatD family deoxyribonuclease [Candidatus Abyssubacteria bacterium SURF_5]